MPGMLGIGDDWADVPWEGANPLPSRGRGWPFIQPNPDLINAISSIPISTEPRQQPPSGPVPRLPPWNAPDAPAAPADAPSLPPRTWADSPAPTNGGTPAPAGGGMFGGMPGWGPNERPLGWPEPPKPAEVPNYAGAPYADMGSLDTTGQPINVPGPAGGAMASANMPAAPPPMPTGADAAPAAALDAIAKKGNIPETSLLGRISEGLGKNPMTLLAMGSGLLSGRNWREGLAGAFGNAIPAMAMDRKTQAENQTVDALVQKGIPRDIAVAASNNPEILKQLIPQLFGAKQLQHVTIKDRLGNETPLTFDPSSGRYRTATGQPYGAPGPGGLSSTGDPTKIGPEFMATLDPMTRNEVKAFGEYRAPVTARNLQTMLPLVTQAYPGFDATRYPALVALRKSYEGGGKDFQEAQAINTVSGHMLKLAEAAEALPNTSVPIWNKGVNWFKDTFTGSPELARFRNAVVTTNNELAKAYHGGHVSDAAVAAFNKAMNESQTPNDMKAAIGEISGLLQSKIEAKESGFKQAFAGTPLPEDYKATNDEARHAYKKIGEWSRGIKMSPAPSHGPAAPATPAAPAAPVAPGKYIMQNDGTLLRQQ